MPETCDSAFYVNTKPYDLVQNMLVEQLIIYNAKSGT